MKILFINNDGGGFADYVDVAPNTNIHCFVSERLSGRPVDNYLIRVNRLSFLKTPSQVVMSTRQERDQPPARILSEANRPVERLSLGNSIPGQTLGAIR